MAKDGVAYFAQGTITKRIKIGFTAGSSLNRISQLQIGSPEQLVLLREIWASQLFEKHAHEVFAAHRVHGEWFEPHEDILNFIAYYSPPDGLTLTEKWEEIQEVPLDMLRRSLYGCPSDL